jgi:hypothetical protein
MQNSQEQLPKRNKAMQLDLCYVWLQYGMDEDDELSDVQLVWLEVKEHLLKIDAEFLMIMLRSMDKGEYLTQQQVSEIEHSTKEELVEILLPYFYHVPGKGMGKAMASTGKGKGAGQQQNTGKGGKPGPKPTQFDGQWMLTHNLVPGQDQQESDGSNEQEHYKKESDDSDFKINVKMPADETITLHVEALYDVDTVKALIKNKEGIPKKSFGLMYDDKLMEDHKTLHYYKVMADAELQLALVLSGGGKRARGDGAGNNGEDKEARIRRINDDAISRATLLATPMYRCDHFNRMIAKIQGFDRLCGERQNVVLDVMNMLPLVIKKSAIDSLNTTNMAHRVSQFARVLFKPGYDWITVQKEGLKKLDELLALTCESALIRIYQKTGKMNWEALNSDVLDSIARGDGALDAGMDGEEDGLADGFGGLALG